MKLRSCMGRKRDRHSTLSRTRTGEPVITYPVKPTLTNAPAKEKADNSAKKPVVSATVLDDGYIRLKWKKVKGAERYRVYRVKDNDRKQIAETRKTSVKIRTKRSGEYKYAVSAKVNGKWTVIKPADVVTVTVD